MRVRQVLVTIAIGAAITGLAACGGGSNGSSTANHPTQQQRLVAAMTSFAQCARQYGVPVPDPDPNGQIPGIEGIKNKYINTPQGHTVLSRCATQLRTAQLLSDRAQGTSPAGLVRFAKCMRRHGIPITVPGPNGEASGSATVRINKRSPQVQQAARVCTPLQGTAGR
jgi:hypothetical protein